jgi:inosine-uridine nucleoside N-ribohydrolase
MGSRARSRVIIDNDFSGDPDDLFALAHHVASSTVDIRMVIASHLSPGDWHDPSERQAENAARVAEGALAFMGKRAIPVLAGANKGISDRGPATDSEAVRAIIAEAMRTDTDLPLYYAAGGGLTELATAWLVEPRIAERLTLVWIGGGEYEGRQVAPGAALPEYNTAIDVAAAQIIFNRSAIPIIQIPRDAYRQCLVSVAELDVRVRPRGPVGALLMRELDRVVSAMEAGGHLMGETYVMGDSPLVLVTALQTPWQPDSASSEWELRATPRLAPDGGYLDRAVESPRPITVCVRVDTRLLFEDFFAKIAMMDT